MNNNRGNNRRRGRGNNRQQGGQPVNRIDSRARGNAPQLLEKYRKLAHDAHLNGDRVTEEYNLQFADHYFRVIADQRQRQEEARQPRRDDRPQDYDRGQDYGDDYGTEDDIYGESAAPSGNGNQDRGSPDRGQDRGNQQRGGYDRNRDDRPQRFEREPQVQAPAEMPAETAEVAGEEAPEGERSIYEPVANPFVRDNRTGRGLKQRKPRGQPREEDGNASDGEAQAEPAAATFDPAALPPSISTKPAEPAAEEAVEEKPKRRRTRKAAPPSDDGDGKLEAVNG